MKDLSSRGEHVCDRCGYVAPFAYIDETSEFRQFALEHGVKNKSRAEFVGDDMVEDLSTGVAYDGSSRAKRLSLLNKRSSQDSTRVRLNKHLRNIRSMASSLNLEKSISDRAFGIYKELMEKDLMKTIKTATLDASCLHYACAHKGTSLPLNLLSRHAGVSEKELQKIHRQLGQALPSLLEYDDPWETQVKQYIQPLKLNSVVEEAALAVGLYVRKNGLCQGKHRKSVLGAILAFASESSPDAAMHKTLEEISARLGPQPETIRLCLEEIRVHGPALEGLEAMQKLLSGARP
jgi:transcription initiation factor TFIIIB Brf1 subunit/transcription initiation factor TFIIB